MLQVPCGTVRESAPHSHSGIQVLEVPSFYSCTICTSSHVAYQGKGETGEFHCLSFSLPPFGNDIPSLIFHWLQLVSLTGRGWETKGSTPLTSYVFVGKLFSLSVSQFFHLLTEDNCSFLSETVSGLNQFLQVSQQSS